MAGLAVFLAVTEAAGAGSVLPGTGFRERQCAAKAIRHVLLPRFETMGAGPGPFSPPGAAVDAGWGRCFSHVLLGYAKERAFPYSRTGPCPGGFGVANRLCGPWDSSRPAGEKAGAKQPFRITAKWGWAGGAVALAAGVAGYIMKVQADRAYDRYMDTVVPESMDRYFEEAVRYDKISGACYVFGEACLVFSLVVFIKTVGAE